MLQPKMRILFDFELFGDPQVDAQMFEIMLSVKRELHLLLGRYDSQITTDAGLILVTVGPGKLSVRYHYSDDHATFLAVNKLLLRLNWDDVIDRQSHTADN